MFLFETLEVALSTPEFQVNFIDSSLEEASELVSVAAFLGGILGGLAVSLILSQVCKVRLQGFQLILVLLDYLVTEMRSLSQFFLNFLMQFEVFLKGLDL